MNFSKKWRWWQAWFPLFAYARTALSETQPPPASGRCAYRKPGARPGGGPRRHFEILAPASTPSVLDWKEYNVDGVVTVRLHGEIDLQHSPKLRRLLQRKACARTPALLLDFTEVSRIDSSGLATLMEYYQHAQRFGGRLAVAGLTDRVQSLFYVVRFSEIFPIYSSIDEALKALQQAASEQNPL